MWEERLSKISCCCPLTNGAPTTNAPLVIQVTNGAPPGAPLVSGILMAHRGCAISIGQGAPLVCLLGAMYTQVLWHTKGARPRDAPLVTAAYYWRTVE